MQQATTQRATTHAATQQATTPTLDAELARKIDAYWRAANYLSVGQIYLCDNPLLKEPLALAHVKRMLQIGRAHV